MRRSGGRRAASSPSTPPHSHSSSCFPAPTSENQEKHGARLNLPDGVIRPQANPLGNGTVLLLSFGKLLLGAEGLLALFPSNKKLSQQNTPFHQNQREGNIRTGILTVVQAIKSGWVACRKLSSSLNLSRHRAGPRQSANVTRIILCGRLSLTTLVLAGLCAEILLAIRDPGAPRGLYLIWLARTGCGENRLRPPTPRVRSRDVSTLPGVFLPRDVGSLLAMASWR